MGHQNRLYRGQNHPTLISDDDFVGPDNRSSPEADINRQILGDAIGKFAYFFQN
jgi:hypothetical protein